MIKRQLQKLVTEISHSSRILSITGPRQSGKTTLAKDTFPDYQYYNLELPDTFRLAQSDPQSFLGRGTKRKIIIDEIQRFPDLFSYLQVLADEHQIPAQYIITGSQQFSLNAKITQSLAGRVANMTLLPFSIAELTNNKKGALDHFDLMQRGFYPALYDNPHLTPGQFYADYVFTYVERDVRQIKNIGDLTNFQRFLELIAGRVGQVLNLNSLGSDIGVSYKTISSWLSVLEASYIIFRLPPYFENLGKRLIKSPKIYFHDTGLLCYLLGIESKEMLKRHYSLGQIFENFVINEILKHKHNTRANYDLYFIRDNNKNEVDLIIDTGLTQYGIEIKSGTSYSDDLLSGLNYYQKLPSQKQKKTFLLYTGSDTNIVNNHQILNWSRLDQITSQL